MSNTLPENWDKSQRAELATSVKPLRQAADLTQSQLADEVKVSRQTIINIEKGLTTPQTDVLVRILRALGVETNEPEFEQQTELWLTMMGTIIETIPAERRQPAVNSAIRILGNEVKGPSVRGLTQDDRNAVDELPRIGRDVVVELREEKAAASKRAGIDAEAESTDD